MRRKTLNSNLLNSAYKVSYPARAELLVNMISTFVGHLMPSSLYTYVLNIYNLFGLGFMAYQPL